MADPRHIPSIDALCARPAVIAMTARHGRPATVDALRRAVTELFHRLVTASPELPDEMAAAAANLTDPRHVVYLVASVVPTDVATRQALLEMDPVVAKLRRLVDLLQREVAVRELGRKITSDTEERLSQRQRLLLDMLRNVLGADLAAPRRLRQVTPPRVGLALLDDAQEQFFEGRGWVANKLHLPAVTLDQLAQVPAKLLADLHATGLHLDAVSKANRSTSWFDPMRLLTGRLPVVATGVLETQNGSGRFVLESATVSGVPVPRTVLQRIVSYYSSTPDDPDGICLDDAFALPAQIVEIRVQPGQALVVQ